MVLLNSLKHNDLIEDEDSKKVVVKKDPNSVKEELVGQFISILQWIFGWLPRSQIVKLEELKDKLIPPKEDYDDEEHTNSATKL